MFTLFLIGMLAALFVFVKVGEFQQNCRIDKEFGEALARSRARSEIDRIERERIETEYEEKAKRRREFDAALASPAAIKKQAREKKREAKLARLIAEYEESTAEGYQGYLVSPLWAYVRRAALKRDKKRCQVCRSMAKLEVHHVRYSLDALYGRDPSALVVLCHTCHHRIHFGKTRKKRSLAQANAILKRLMPYRLLYKTWAMFRSGQADSARFSCELRITLAV